MTHVSQKKAKDYEAPKGLEDNRSAKEIEADLERVREELTATVNELAGKLRPENLKAEAVNMAKTKFEHYKEQTIKFFNDAKAGDKRALAIIGGTLAGVALLVVTKVVKK